MTYFKGTILAIVCSVASLSSPTSMVAAFSMPMFTEQKTMQRTTPSKTDGVEIEIPNFDELFGRIKEVSPLAALAIDGKEGNFQVADELYPSSLKWKKVESNKRKTVHQIEKIDNFQGLGCPMVRFRASLKGPCIGMKFASFIMDLEERKKWDPQIEQVDEIFPIYDVDAANIAMDFQYGDCKRLGIGYCQTKSNPVVDGREQLILCGIQDMPNQSTVIWGTELEEWHNHLFPQDIPRRTRAKSHLFASTLVPTGPDSFDVEYILQLEVGGNIPAFLTTPVLVQTVKGMFNYAEKTFGDEEVMAPWVKQQEEIQDSMIAERQQLLMPL
ncbi:hypothetical protein CTEN210_08863 [Chaetoceros tenuissimus]|uniref:START domain-containing protein n=1 Tax=Chaetoceros tenuissimus TaxID=426638 RepID=A0AAD3CUN7_9STRA|nr:hypothetical protein CTEN210_08863 [Chaetoceros tenuissimus]